MESWEIYWCWGIENDNIFSDTVHSCRKTLHDLEWVQMEQGYITYCNTNDFCNYS